jgi:hypothetical protein
MATSGSVDFQNTRTQLIESALRKCNVLREGVSASANKLTTGSLALNTILKSFMAMGMPLWAVLVGAVFPIHDTNTVTLGPSGGHAATTWTHTQLSASSSGTTIDVDSITGISASDSIGVELDDGTIHWTTVNGAPAGSTVTLTVALASVASEDNHVYVYTNKIVRPLKIIQACTFDYTDNTESELNIVSRDEFLRISNKTVEGPTNQIYYEPFLTRGTLNIYPRFPNGDQIIKIWFQRPFEDMDNATDNLDFPQEWESAIIWELAATLAHEEGVPERKMQMIQQKAIFEKQQVEAFGMEEGSIFFTPEMDAR